MALLSLPCFHFLSQLWKQEDPARPHSNPAKQQAYVLKISAKDLNLSYICTTFLSKKKYQTSFKWHHIGYIFTL